MTKSYYWGCYWQRKGDDEGITDWGRLHDVSDNEPETVIAEPAVTEWDHKNMAVSANTIKHILTRYNSAVKAPNKIKNKYRKKIIGKKNKDVFKKESDDNNKFKKTSTDWLKSAGYLDAKDQDVISYIYVPPKKTEQNKISADAGH